MKSSEYLDAAKKIMHIASDYELAKKLNARPEHMGEMRNGKRSVPLSIAYKLAITLEIDPAQVVAELEAEREKNPARKEFWKSFLSHASKASVLLLCMLVLGFSAGAGSDLGATGGAFNRRRRFA
jgi:hypothetical protein